MNSLETIPFERIDGTPATLQDFAGKVRLIVNVASKCGLTPQYAALEALYAAKHGDGLEILGFPANNFKGQEPGTNSEIAEFCSITYGVTFPMFAKISVKGEDRHPLYRALTEAFPAATDLSNGAFREKLTNNGLVSGDRSDVLWNFEKFILSRDGRVVARFNPDVLPDDPALVAALERELAAA